uniref:Uncharacterized protein n=1 Tax=Cucumis melo TaxID=3656 RepID=A0A9I9EK27_CUCME
MEAFFPLVTMVSLQPIGSQSRNIAPTLNLHSSSLHEADRRTRHLCPFAAAAVLPSRRRPVPNPREASFAAGLAFTTFSFQFRRRPPSPNLHLPSYPANDTAPPLSSSDQASTTASTCQPCSPLRPSRSQATAGVSAFSVRRELQRRWALIRPQPSRLHLPLQAARVPLEEQRLNLGVHVVFGVWFKPLLFGGEKAMECHELSITWAMTVF